MATNQAHHDVRFALTKAITDILVEKASLATSVARNTAIGTPSVGDGGTASTGQLGNAVAGLTELIDPAEGDTDFDGINPIIADITQSNSSGSPIDLSPDSGKAIIFRAANVLPFYLLRLLPQPSGSAIIVTPYVAKTEYSKGVFNGSADKLSIATITLQDVGISVPTNDYKLEISNPLDVAASVAVSNVVWITATP